MTDKQNTADNIFDTLAFEKDEDIIQVIEAIERCDKELAALIRAKINY